ncbi:RIP metalloprotease RseP [Streptococcus panodentis]|uniref:Zinc metalloprotease n=1 Tax=Streptococcus panodentis TaxID=1581472 RepID=A0ABS5AZN7_9STRE|nr:RIP metalloprotease RseP [Streptococcus panodentis]MBP2622030.1 RIP metalloprotease RseP [Streptococcus panodentis]
MQFVTFIIIFGVIVVVHEFGHFYFAKKSGILVREFAIGMGPKIFSHIGKDGTAYTIRILPLGGYVRMAGWGEDSTDIKIGTPASLTLDEEGKVVRINLSGKKVDQTALPMSVTAFDFEEKLEITGLVLEELATYPVDHDATIVEEDGTEVRIAPLDVQYQNASIWGRLITNFAGPMNNFILSVFVFMLLAFVQGGVQDVNSNHFRVMDGGAVAAAGIKSDDQIVKVNGYEIANWSDLTEAIAKSTADAKEAPQLQVTYKSGGKTQEATVEPKKEGDRYLIGVSPAMKTGFWDKVLGAFTATWTTTVRILTALKDIIFNFNINNLGGPVAIYNFSSQAAQQGLPAVLNLLAMLSLNIGIFNLIPIPALDGGKIVLNILEVIRRKPLKRETETYVTLAGVAVMVLLMIVVTWNDIMKLFF